MAHTVKSLKQVLTAMPIDPTKVKIVMGQRIRRTGETTWAVNMPYRSYPSHRGNDLENTIFDLATS